MSLTRSGQAGLRYNPSISSSLQRDIVSWLDMREQPELEANNIYVIPDNAYQTIEVGLQVWHASNSLPRVSEATSWKEYQVIGKFEGVIPVTLGKLFDACQVG